MEEFHQQWDQEEHWDEVALEQDGYDGGAGVPPMGLLVHIIWDHRQAADQAVQRVALLLATLQLTWQELMEEFHQQWDQDRHWDELALVQDG